MVGGHLLLFTRYNYVHFVIFDYNGNTYVLFCTIYVIWICIILYMASIRICFGMIYEYCIIALLIEDLGIYISCLPISLLLEKGSS